MRTDDFHGRRSFAVTSVIGRPARVARLREGAVSFHTETDVSKTEGDVYNVTLPHRVVLHVLWLEGRIHWARIGCGRRVFKYFERNATREVSEEPWATLRRQPTANSKSQIGRPPIGRRLCPLRHAVRDLPLVPLADQRLTFPSSRVHRC